MRKEENQALISSTILDEIIMKLMRRIEEEEVISGCITSRREARVIWCTVHKFDTAKNSDLTTTPPPKH